MSDTNEFFVQGYGDGRRTSEKCGVDGSSWSQRISWHCATANEMPVCGHIVLVQDSQGRVLVCDFREVKAYDDMIANMRKCDAKWWSYMPDGPPLNVHPLPWKQLESGEMVTQTPDDPDKLIHARNIPAITFTEAVFVLESGEES